MVFSLIGKGVFKIVIHEYSGNVEHSGVFGGNGVSEFLLNYSVLVLIVFSPIFLHRKIAAGAYSQTELESTFFQSMSIAFLLIVLEVFGLITYFALVDA